MGKKSEDELSETFDRCLADTAVKIVSAGSVGLIAAAIFKRQFPLWLGTGMGFGMGIANCRHDMRKLILRFAPGSLLSIASMDEKRVDCLDLLTFQDMLDKLRKIDDKILFELNTALPSESFSSNMDKGEKCRSIYKELLTMRVKRMNLIQHCVDENQTNISRLRKEKSPIADIRSAQNTLRVIRSEMDVESIVNDRSEKAVHDRCRTFL
ncbi:MGC82625 protein, putative [Brugia malayi]|uniref:MICOS complex subunit MIC10 n=1 Tax=Brugia malayi TaxID=6279 RepID=A0A0H5S8G9_BRUMA|nr:MGC82625 protein, putative [Brugia malayi]CRZ24684.1 Bm4332 [Brugia malayi]VIO97393.1 MGC82625 protein, putative [Brugia malayi]